MYRKYYRLKEEPFNITPDPAFFFLSPSHKEALASIIYGVEKRKGFLSITGEVGSGKTTVLRTYLDQIDTDKVKVVYLFNPDLSFKDLLETILRELGVPAPASEVFEMVNQLGHFLVEEFRQNRNVVLLIDEAQNIPMQTLESLRMLSNLETATTKLIQIVLVGQPELENMLNRHELRQLKQRIAVRVGIQPLTSDESFQYIDFRLNKAALKKTKVFTKGALKEIVREAAGIPRLLNILCNNCLVSGYGYQKKPITRRIAKETIVDLHDRRVSRLYPWGYAAAAVLMLSLGLWGMLTYGGRALSDGEDGDTQEKIVMTDPAPNDPSLSPVTSSSSSEEVDATASTKTPRAQSMPSAPPPGTSTTDATAVIGQGGLADRKASSVEPMVIPQTPAAVKTKLARRDDPEETTAAAQPHELDAAAADPPTPTLGPTAAAQKESLSDDKAWEQAEAVSVHADAEAQANASSVPVDPERPAEPREQAELVAMGAGATLPVDRPETGPPAFAPPVVGSGSDPPEPWSRARTLFQQGRIAEAASLWQSTYLDSSADRIAVEVELNCQPKTLQDTFEMLSAPNDFYILPYRHQGELCYRVRLGPFATRIEAASRARQIKGAMGYAKPWVKKVRVSSARE